MAAVKKIWSKPEVKTLDAGAAENGQTTGDDNNPNNQTS